MTHIDPQEELGQLVAERPARARVLESFGLDYCCGGRRSFADACREQGLSLDRVLAELARADDAPRPPDETDWRTSSLGALAQHIVATHHVYLRREMPRLAELFDKVTAVHGERHPELHRMERVYRALQDEMYAHLSKEENILFPMLEQLDAAGPPSAFHCGSIQNPIRVMLMEHDSAAEALHELGALSRAFTPPADACESFRALYAGLAELEADTHQHIHLENNILFPRATTAAPAPDAAYGGR